MLTLWHDVNERKVFSMNPFCVLEFATALEESRLRPMLDSSIRHDQHRFCLEHTPLIVSKLAFILGVYWMVEESLFANSFFLHSGIAFH
jgi:hypothetical protein